MSFFFCACIAIHSKEDFSFKENFFKNKILHFCKKKQKRSVKLNTNLL